MPPKIQKRSEKIKKNLKGLNYFKTGKKYSMAHSLERQFRLLKIMIKNEPEPGYSVIN